MVAEPPRPLARAHSAGSSDPRVARESSVEQLAAFAQRQIEGFYEQVADAQGNHRANYFVEKFQPSHVPELVWEMYSRTKEIILVRDFRDLLCSMRVYFDRQLPTDVSSEYYDLIESLKLDGESLFHAWNMRRVGSYLVHYEDLVTRPDQTLKLVLKYLEISLSNSTVISHMLQNASNDMAELQRLHQTSLTGGVDWPLATRPHSPARGSWCASLSVIYWQTLAILKIMT